MINNYSEGDVKVTIVYMVDDGEKLTPLFVDENPDTPYLDELKKQIRIGGILEGKIK